MLYPLYFVYNLFLYTSYYFYDLGVWHLKNNVYELKVKEIVTSSLINYRYFLITNTIQRQLAANIASFISLKWFSKILFHSFRTLLFRFIYANENDHVRGTSSI